MSGDKNYLYKVVKVTNKGRIEVEKVNSDDEEMYDVLRRKATKERLKNFWRWLKRKKHIRDLKRKRLLLAESLLVSSIKSIESMCDMQRREEKNID